MEMFRRLQAYSLSFLLAAGTADASLTRIEKKIEQPYIDYFGYTIPRWFMDDFKKLACHYAGECKLDAINNRINVDGYFSSIDDVAMLKDLLAKIDRNEDKRIGREEINEYNNKLYRRLVMEKLGIIDEKELIDLGGIKTSEHILLHLLEYACVLDGKGEAKFKDDNVELNIWCDDNYLEDKPDVIRKLATQTDIDKDGILTHYDLMNAIKDYVKKNNKAD